MQADDYACHASIHYIRYDDTFNFRPTQGHMLIPLTDYHAGASAAAFVGHAHAYDWALAQYFGAGLINTQVGGSTLYSDEATHSKIKWWTSFVKLYRSFVQFIQKQFSQSLKMYYVVLFYILYFIFGIISFSSAT